MAGHGRTIRDIFSPSSKPASKVANQMDARESGGDRIFKKINFINTEKNPHFTLL